MIDNHCESRALLPTSSALFTTRPVSAQSIFDDIRIFRVRLAGRGPYQHRRRNAVQHPIAEIESSLHPSIYNRDANRWTFGFSRQTMVVIDLFWPDGKMELGCQLPG